MWKIQWPPQEKPKFKGEAEVRCQGLEVADALEAHQTFQ